MEDRDQDMKYCKLCLVTDVKMFSMNTPSILEAYSQLVQNVVCQDYQAYVCYECVSLLHKCQEFRMKCVTALNVLSSIHMDHSKISTELVQNIDRNSFNLESKLACCSILLCNSNDQYIIPISCFKPDVKEEEYKCDMIVERLENKFKMDACDKNHTRLQDINDSNDIITKLDDYESDKNDNVKEIKIEQKQLTKNNKNATKSNNNLEQITRNIDNEPTAKKAKKTRSKKNVFKNDSLMEVCEQINKKKKEPDFDVSYFKDYATVVLLTPDDVKKELLLRKESANYKNNPHKCDLCYRGYEFKQTFDNHMKKHSLEYGRWECEYCHLRFTLKAVFCYHMSHVHKRKFICKICPYVCYDTRQAKAHMDLHKGKRFTCKECGEVFSMANSLCAHRRKRHPTEAVCALCGSAFPAPQGLNVHQKRLHGQENIELVGPKCEECDVQFATETAWKRHLVLSSKHTVLNGCKYCGDTFSSRTALRQHYKHHPGKTMKKSKGFVPPAACKICNKWLTTRSEYKDHMTSQHPQAEERKQFVCEVCGTAFKKKASLGEHTHKHTGARPYTCGECGKAFPLRSSLYVHARTHAARTRVFQCDACHKQYYAKSALVKHVKTHLGVGPHSCPLCDKSYHYKCEVKYHMDHVHRRKPCPKRERAKRPTND